MIYFNLYIYIYIAMKVFPENDLPSLDLAKTIICIVLLSAGVSARNSDIECAVQRFPINIHLASRSLVRNVECSHQWCQELNNKNKTPALLCAWTKMEYTRLKNPTRFQGFASLWYMWSQWEIWGIFNWSSIQFYIMPLNHCNCVTKHFCCTITSIWKWKCK